MNYNERTSGLIKTWLAKFGVQPIYYKVLRSMFGQAWREVTYQSHGGINYLARCREYRSRHLWEFAKCLQSQRVKERYQQIGQGPRCEWEDALCMALGTSWREQRDMCKSRADWMSMFPQFAETV